MHDEIIYRVTGRPKGRNTRRLLGEFLQKDWQWAEKSRARHEAEGYRDVEVKEIVQRSKKPKPKPPKDEDS